MRQWRRGNSGIAGAGITRRDAFKRRSWPAAAAEPCCSPSRGQESAATVGDATDEAKHDADWRRLAHALLALAHGGNPEAALVPHASPRATAFYMNKERTAEIVADGLADNLIGSHQNPCTIRDDACQPVQ
jgi:hypothetical protein